MDWLQEAELREEETETALNQYLTFAVSEQFFGISISDVVEIISLCPIAQVPQFSGYAKGIINLRGRIIPVVDVRLRFHLPEKEYDGRTCIIITNINELDIGFIVDEVREVMDIDPADVEPAPKLTASYAHRFITGVGKRSDKMILLLDSQRLLNEEETAALDVTQM
ncbi:MAG: chemotaxis protein CheW [Gracilibacteraceae bacterium]|jgi:purine-binding chemotaxis protein CheW|nr:chemotaxis protein CheW [Gracilibacteraceae bacterium]